MSYIKYLILSIGTATGLVSTLSPSNQTIKHSKSFKKKSQKTIKHNRNCACICGGRDKKQTNKEHIGRALVATEHDIPIRLSHIVGLQKKIMLALFESCKLTGKNVTKEVSLESLVASTGGNKGSIKTSINRLKEKACIRIIEAKNGRCGWVVYEVSKGLYGELLSI